MLKVNLQKFADNVAFVELNIDKFLEKYESANPTNQLKNNTLYFVHMNSTSGDLATVPYLLFKGKNLIGNSGSIIRQSTNGVLTVNGVEVNITVPTSLSTNLRGLPGQTLFIIDIYESQDGATDATNTYMYYWDDTDPIVENGSIVVNGQWKNANINWVSSFSFGDLDISVEDLRKLKALLV